MLLMNNIVLAFAVGSNHALQRTAPCVTAPASTAAHAGAAPHSAVAELGVVMPLRITNKVLATD